MLEFSKVSEYLNCNLILLISLQPDFIDLKFFTFEFNKLPKFYQNKVAKLQRKLKFEASEFLSIIMHFKNFKTTITTFAADNKSCKQLILSEELQLIT